MKNPDPQFLVIDLFCGAGGTTIGAVLSRICKVIAAVNHNPLAIESHSANHSDVFHITEDILLADLTELLRVVAYWKAKYPNAKLVLWASLECTNFSDAKGGLPRDADSRSLADGMFRYLDTLNPDYFLIENVEEFMSWGPMLPKVTKAATGDFCPLYYKDNRPGPHLIPESRTAGKDYVRWVKAIQGYGYKHDWRLLNAANFGGVTIRERYFGAFYRPSLPFAWPQRTHAKRPSNGKMFADEMKPWRAVAEVLNFDDLGTSIFERKRPLVDKTLRRILAGLKKFHSQPQIMVCNSPGYTLPVTRPIPTLTTVNSKAMVTPILQSYYGKGVCRGVDQPSPTVTTKDRLSLITPFIYRDFRSPSNRSIHDPAGALLTVPKMNLVSARWLVDMRFKNIGKPVTEPSPTLLTGQHQYLATAFLVPSSFDNAARPLTDPAPTILASRKHLNLATAFIVNPQYKNKGSSVHDPAPTVIAQQRSRPLSLATAKHEGPAKWDIQPGDTAAMVELKTFMRETGIADVYMRMLEILELKRIQGFPDDYVLCGTKNDQKMFIGNSVETGVVSSWFSAIGQAFATWEIKLF
jgi:DNA (cytosine-5)-methyltransferase 1